MAPAGEVGELVAELQWPTPAEASTVKNDVDQRNRVRFNCYAVPCRCEVATATIFLAATWRSPRVSECGTGLKENPHEHAIVPRP